MKGCLGGGAPTNEFLCWLLKMSQKADWRGNNFKRLDVEPKLPPKGSTDPLRLRDPLLGEEGRGGKKPPGDPPGEESESRGRLGGTGGRIQGGRDPPVDSTCLVLLTVDRWVAGDGVLEGKGMDEGT